MLNILLAPCKAIYHFIKYFFKGLLVIPKAIISMINLILIKPFKKSNKPKTKKKENKDINTKLNDFGENIISSTQNAADFIDKQSNKISFVKEAKEAKIEKMGEIDRKSVV